MKIISYYYDYMFIVGDFFYAMNVFEQCWLTTTSTRNSTLIWKRKVSQWNMIFKLDHDQLKGLSHEIESAVFDMHVQMNNWKNLQGLVFFIRRKM
jgi:hypothetical protein